MPRGNPNAQTKATDKYQKKAGYKTKAFKLRGDIAERFASACEQAGVSQAEKITELMEMFVAEANNKTE